MLEREFFKAVKNGNLGQVQELLLQDPKLIDATEKDGSTPLHLAAWRGHTAIVDVLIAAGANVHTHNENDHWGTTPLHAAAHGNQVEAAAALIRGGANVNAVKSTGTGTPLAETHAHKALRVAKLLREHGAIE